VTTTGDLMSISLTGRFFLVDATSKGGKSEGGNMRKRWDGWANRLPLEKWIS